MKFETLKLTKKKIQCKARDPYDHYEIYELNFSKLRESTDHFDLHDHFEVYDHYDHFEIHDLCEVCEICEMGLFEKVSSDQAAFSGLRRNFGSASPSTNCPVI